MERVSQSKYSRLIQILNNDIWQVNFYRFCQLLEQEHPELPKLGAGSHPASDPVRFRPWQGMGFPVSTLKAVETDELHSDSPPTVRTTFLGLYGVDSPLPGGYLDDIAMRRDGHEALTSFLDIFNHRIITQYYRIWRKNAYPVTFEAGGQDTTSKCLLGLVGLGIPGTTEQLTVPASCFLALLGTLRLPTRNSEGIRALVRLLAPDTRITVIEPCLIHIPVEKRTALLATQCVRLSQRLTLGQTGKEACSRVQVTLMTQNRQEAVDWLPGGQNHRDLLVLMRIYLGYRSEAQLRLTIPVHLLPDAQLNKNSRIQLAYTGLLGLKKGKLRGHHKTLTLNLGCYVGLRYAPLSAAEHGQYRFR